MTVPVLQALVLAEHVYCDTSGKKIIAGTFNAITRTQQSIEDGEDGTKSTKVPGGGMGAPWFYLSLTDVVEGTTIGLQFVSLTKNSVLFEQDITLNGMDRLQSVEVAGPLPDLVKNVPKGIYSFEVICKGEIIGSRRLYVDDVEEG